MDFEKICMMFTMQEPFYGILLSAMNKEPCTQHPSIGVGISGNVFKMIYNPDWLGNLPVDTQLELLKHEILHLAFNHPTMWTRQKEMDPEMHDLHNQACDYEVNCYIDRTKIPKEIGGCFVEDKSWDKCLGAKEYFARLLKEYQSQQQQQNAKNPNKPCNGGGGGSEQNNQDQNDSASQDNQSNGQEQDNNQQQNSNQQQQNSDAGGNGHSNSFDSHQEWSQFKEDDVAQNATDMVESLLDMAAQECEKSQGTVPAEMEQLIEKIRSRKPKPVADWKRYCRRYLGNEFSEFFRKSKKRESKRFPDAAGTRHQRKSNILVAIDTSGSVSMPEYHEFFGQIKTMCATSNFHVLECDAKIQYEYDFRGKIHDSVHGGGGTLFEPVIDYYLKNKKKYDALVYFTDGGASIPPNTPKDTLWIISSKGNHNRERYKVNGASVAIIPPQPAK